MSNRVASFLLATALMLIAASVVVVDLVRHDQFRHGAAMVEAAVTPISNR